MTVARQKANWDHTAAILQKIHNVNCQSTAHMIRDVRTLNPYRAAETEDDDGGEATIDDVTAAFLGADNGR